MFESFYELHRDRFPEILPYVNYMRLWHKMKRWDGSLMWQSASGGRLRNGKNDDRRLGEELDETRFKLLYLSDSKLTPRHIYKGLLKQLGCESKFYRGDAKTATAPGD